MTFKLPLETRMRLAADKRRRYWASDAERLKRINEARAFRGAGLIESLDQMGSAKGGRVNAPRDRAGRFASKV